MAEGDALLDIVVKGQAFRDPKAMPIQDFGKLLLALGDLFTALAEEEGVPYTFGLSRVSKGSVVAELAPHKMSKAVARKRATHLHAVLSGQAQTSSADVARSVERVMSSAEGGKVRVRGTGALLKILRERPVVPTPQTPQLLVTSIVSGRVVALRELRNGLSIRLRSATNGELLDITVPTTETELVVNRFRKGIKCRVQFSRTASGERRAIAGERFKPWDQTSLLELPDKIQARVRNINIDAALRSLNDDEEEGWEED